MPAAAAPDYLDEPTTRLVSSTHHHILLIYELPAAEQPAGYGIAVRKVVPAMPATKIGMIEELFVVADRRAAGLGRHLFTAMRSVLATAGVTRLEVQVLAANEAAMRFWQKCQFRAHLLVLETNDLDGQWEDSGCQRSSKV